MEINSDTIITLGGVMTVMTGFVTYVSSVIADKKVQKAADEIEDQMHSEHQKQGDKLEEVGAQILNRIEEMKQDITEISVNVGKVTQRQDDSDRITDGHKRDIIKLYDQDKKMGEKIAKIEGGLGQ